MSKLQNKMPKVLVHGVLDSPSVKALLYESGCFTDEEIANSEAAKDSQKSQFIASVLQSKSETKFRELIQFLISRKDQEESQKLLLIFSDSLSKGKKFLSCKCVYVLFDVFV